jgi:hypothetical protein
MTKGSALVYCILFSFLAFIFPFVGQFVGHPGDSNFTIPCCTFPFGIAALIFLIIFLVKMGGGASVSQQASRQVSSPQPSLKQPVYTDTSTSNQQTEILEVEAVVEDMMMGASFVTNLLGSPSMYKCKLIARVFSPTGNYELAPANFSKMGSTPIELLEGTDRKEAQEALDWLNTQAIADGWQPIARGSFWYSYRYQRPYYSANTSPSVKISSEEKIPAQKWVKEACDLGEQGDFDAALVAINRAIQLDPNYAEAYTVKAGALFYGLGRNEEALTAINRAIQLDPNNGEFYFAKGDILEGLEKNEEAQRAYKRAKQLGYTEEE